MFLFVFAGAKRRNGEIAKFQSLITALHSATVASFLIHFIVLSLVFELKQNLEAQPYPEMKS